MIGHCGVSVCNWGESYLLGSFGLALDYTHGKYRLCILMDK